MEPAIAFSKKFSRRMFVLAVIIGVITATAMPLTYFAMSYREREQYALLRGEILAYDIQRAIQDNPELWFFDIPRFIETAHRLPQSETVARIRVYEQAGAVAFEQNYSSLPSFYAITTRTPVKYLGQTYGWLELIENMDSLYISTAMITAVFCLLGVLFFFVIYRYPRTIVATAEGRVMAVVEQLQASQKVLQEMAIRDPVTHLFNASYLRQKLEEEIEAVECAGGTLWIMLLRLDYFGKSNNFYAHLHRDGFLQQMAVLLSEHIRPWDTLGKFGDEAFLLIMPGVEGGRAEMIAKQLQYMAEMHEFGGETEKSASRVRLSIGMTEWRAGITDRQLAAEAETALHKAEESVGSRICIYNVQTNNA